MTGYKVGDFVRFKSEIMLANPQIALTGDKAIVVGFTDDGKVARVVWSDGQQGEYRRDKLARCEGKVGAVVGSPRNPVRDRGHKPIPVPPRVQHAAMPRDGNPDQYEGFATPVKFYIPGEPKPNKSGEMKDTMIPCLMHKVAVNCKRSGRTFIFTGTHRDGRWKYSGNGHKGLTTVKLGTELARMMGEVKAQTVLAGLVGDAMPISDFKATFAA